MANIGVDSLLQLVASGQLDLRAVTSPSKSLAFMIVAQDAVTNVANLAGHSFGIGRVGSVDQGLSRLVLASQNIDLDNLELVAPGQPAARAQALAARQIDAITMSLGTWTTLPDRTGMHVLVDQDQYFAAAPVVSKVNVVTPEVVAVVTALTKLARDRQVPGPTLNDDGLFKVPYFQLSSLRQSWTADARKLPASWRIKHFLSAHYRFMAGDYLVQRG